MPTYDVSPGSREMQSPYKYRFLTWVLLFATGLLAWDLWKRGSFRLLDPNAKPRPVVARGDLAEDEQATIDLFEENSKCVVHITTANQVRRRGLVGYDIFEVPKGQGSGFVWDEAGYVVTNFHVVEGTTRQTVTLESGESVEAHYVGGDPNFDLAVLKIDSDFERLSPIALGESEDLKVGQKVFALGNPFGLDLTLTTGIISGLDRIITSVGQTRIRGVIQTDAAINPGNSGGPLLDSAGRLIGINTAIFSPSGSSAGIGFAVPVDTINRVVPHILATGEPERAGLGITMASDASARRAGIVGAVVATVMPGSAADRAGLRELKETERGLVMDVITGIENEEVRSRQDVFRLLEGRKVGEQVVLELERDGQRVEVEVELRGLR